MLKSCALVCATRKLSLDDCGRIKFQKEYLGTSLCPMTPNLRFVEWFANLSRLSRAALR